MNDRHDIPLSKRKPRDRAMALLLGGTAVLMPPLVAVSASDLTIAKIPLSFLYVFGIWMLLIVGAAALSRPLWDSDAPDRPIGSEDTDT